MKKLFIILAITLLVLTACKPVPEPAEAPDVTVPEADALPEAEPVPSVSEEAKPGEKEEGKEPPVDPQVILGIVEKTKAVFGE